MYEGDVMFEHCYRLDIDAAVPVSEKRACWDRWLATNTRGQTRDRVEFAAGRSRALLAGPTASGIAFLRVADPRVAEPASTSGAAVACPLPETPFEAPPSTLTAAPAKATTAPATRALVPATATSAPSPRKACFDACAAELSTCASKCGSPRCSQKCAEDVKRCMGGCP